MADDFSNSSSVSGPSSLPPSSSSVDPYSTPPDDLLVGETDTIDSMSLPQAQFFVFNFSSPDLDIPLNVYARELGTARIEFTKEDRANDASNPRNTKAYYNEVVERCKLTRKQRDRLQDYFNSWNSLVDKINGEINDFNPYITTYNTQVSNLIDGDNLAIAALNAAIAQFNIDGIEANLVTAVNAYNAHFAAANTGIATYDDAATAFNDQVAANNDKITQLNQRGAGFFPPPPAIPLQTPATLAGQVAPYPGPPYTPPLLPLPSRPTFALMLLYPVPPDPSFYTDPTLSSDQSVALNSIIQTRQMLDRQDVHLEFVSYNLRGTRPQAPNAYIDELPQPASGGAASSLTGLSAQIFGDKQVMMENQLSLQTMVAALSDYDRGPVRSPSVQFSDQENVREFFFKQDVAQAAIDLLFRAAKQAGVAASTRFEGEFSNTRAADDVSNILVASELLTIANNFNSPEGKEVLKNIATELVLGADFLQNLSPQDKLAAIADIQALLQNILTQFSLQNLAQALKTPGLIPQVLGNAAPELSRALQPPTEAESLNALLRSQGIQLQQLKNALIDSLLLTGEVRRRETIQTANAALQRASTLAPYQSFEEFFNVLRSLLTTGAPPPDFRPRQDLQPAALPANPPEQQVVRPLPRISEPALNEALNNTAQYLVNQLPLPGVRGSDLDRQVPYDLIDKEVFPDTAAARRVLEGTTVDRDTFRQVLDNAVSRISLNTARDLRDNVIQESLRSSISLNESVLVGNRLAQEIVDARIAQNSFAVSRLDQESIQASLKSALITEGLRQEQADAASRQVVTDLSQTTQRITNENDLRNYIRDDLVAKNYLSVEQAARASVNANFTIPRTADQVLTSIGADKLLPLPLLAEGINDNAARQLSTALPPERSREVAADIVLKLLGRPPTRNLDELEQLRNTSSVLRLTQDTLSHFENTQNQNFGVKLEREFRERMSLNIDVYSLSREIMDPANIYFKSKLGGISYTRDEPNFRKSIDIIV